MDERNAAADGRSLEDYAGNGEQRQLIEEVVEENAQEFIKHENFYVGKDEEGGTSGVESTHVNGKTGKTEVVKLKKLKKRTHTSMTLIPGRFTRGVIDAFAFILCLIFVAIQLGLIDYYFIKYLKEPMWYSWLAADTFVIITLIWLTVLSMRNNQQRMHDERSLDAKVKYACLGWFTYAAVLVAKIAVCFRLFHQDVLKVELSEKLFDDHLFRLGLSLSVLIFIFFLEANHYTPLTSNRQLYIVYLATAVCIDLIDTIFFLDLLWQREEKSWNLPLWLDIVILSLSCLNFIMPSFALLRLRFRKLPRTFLLSDKLWSLLYVLIVNGPYLGVRIYLYLLLEVPSSNKNYEPSIFIVKNVAFIYLALKELWIRVQYWRHKSHYRKLATQQETIHEVEAT